MLLSLILMGFDLLCFDRLHVTYTYDMYYFMQVIAHQCSQLVKVNTRARNWVQCEVCQIWLHCVCAGLSTASVKKTDYHFVCVECCND